MNAHCRLQSFTARLSNKHCEWSFPSNEGTNSGSKNSVWCSNFGSFFAIVSCLFPPGSRIFQLFEHSCPPIMVFAVWHPVCDCKGRKAGLVSKRNFADQWFCRNKEVALCDGF